MAPTALVVCGCGARFPGVRSILETVTNDFEAAVERFHRPDALFHAAGTRIRRRSRTRLQAAGQTTLKRDLRACATFDVRDRLGAIEVPVLAITGAHDRLTPVAEHRRLAAGLPAGRTATVGAAAHLAFVERPTAWRRIVDAFRRTITAPSAG